MAVRNVGPRVHSGIGGRRRISMIWRAMGGLQLVELRADSVGRFKNSVQRGTDVLGEARVFGAVGIAGTRRLHRYHLADAARPRRHDNDAVAELDRLVDVVSDEENGLALVLPDSHQLVLHALAG